MTKKKPIDVFAVDEGTEQSGWIRFNAYLHKIVDAGICSNEEILEHIERRGFDIFVIEKIVSYGMPIGETTLEAHWWAGRFHEQCMKECPNALIYRMPRREVKGWLCGNSLAKDKHVRLALINRYGEPGTIKDPNPNYPVKIVSHMWAALGLAVTFDERWSEHYSKLLRKDHEILMPEKVKGKKK